MLLQRIAGARRPAPVSQLWNPVIVACSNHTTSQRDDTPDDNSDDDPDDEPAPSHRPVVVGEIITREGIKPYFIHIDPQQTMVPHNVMVTITNDRFDQPFILARVPSWRPACVVLAAFLASQELPVFDLVDLQLSDRCLRVVISTDKTWEELGLEAFLQ